MSNIVVIGKNFGDEGKGLAVSNICRQSSDSLIIKHNGGAQAGHTVETEDGKRFIHHQIGSGAQFGSPTLWIESFHPDLYQLGNEIEKFKDTYGFIPKIYAEGNAYITTIDDVIINMGVEVARKEDRHGSCGMGINECLERGRAGYAISLMDIFLHEEKWIEETLLNIRKEYSIRRANLQGINSDSHYFDLLNDRDIISGFVTLVKENIKYIELIEADRYWLSQYDNLIFESGQGLLLDYDYLQYMPYLTPSKTGIYNSQIFLKKHGLKIDEAIYVTRSYVTRHGEGPLPFQVEAEEIKGLTRDLTNEPNEWQGSMRYGRHESLDRFLAPVFDDAADCDFKISILITHLDETKGLVYFKDKEIGIEEVRNYLNDKIHKIYCSYSRYTTDRIV